jgi:hypothetical protein
MKSGVKRRSGSGKENSWQWAQAEAEAKSAVRKHIDEATFQIGKDSRDNLRQIQRELRDHFTALADELSRSLAESVAAAQTALRGDADRLRRIEDLKAELERVEALAERARKLTAEVTAS